MAGLENKIALVTGASAGIGAATAIHLASIGCRLSLVARNKTNLDQVAAKCREAGSPDVFVTAKDLSTQEDCDAAMAETVEHFGGEDFKFLFATPVVNIFYRVGCACEQCWSHAHGKP